MLNSFVTNLQEIHKNFRNEYIIIKLNTRLQVYWKLSELLISSLKYDLFRILGVDKIYCSPSKAIPIGQFLGRMHLDQNTQLLEC